MDYKKQIVFVIVTMSIWFIVLVSVPFWHVPIKTSQGKIIVFDIISGMYLELHRRFWYERI